MVSERNVKFIFQHLADNSPQIVGVNKGLQVNIIAELSRFENNPRLEGTMAIFLNNHTAYNIA
jgi:hypothetical protein